MRSHLTEPEVLELARVDELAERLREHLDVEHEAITKVHVHGARSGDVQQIVSTLLTGVLGFGEEIVLTPEIGLVTRSRPDFFFRLADDRGVLAEVERGGTTTNNHDLKDFWKAHIAPDVSTCSSSFLSPTRMPSAGRASGPISWSSIEWPPSSDTLVAKSTW